MALLLKKNNCYLRIDYNGIYYIYESAKDRLAEKEAPLFSEINNKYWDLLAEWSNDELVYYDPQAALRYKKLEIEHKRYCQNYYKNKTDEKYPIMQEFIPEINNSIPKIITTGQIGVKGNTLQEIYSFVKKYKLFEETEDC